MRTKAESVTKSDISCFGSKKQGTFVTLSLRGFWTDLIFTCTKSDIRIQNQNLCTNVYQFEDFIFSYFTSRREIFFDEDKVSSRAESDMLTFQGQAFDNHGPR